MGIISKQENERKQTSVFS